MKTHLLYPLMMLSLFCNAQIINIPDANFKDALIDLGVDTNDDGQISQDEAAATMSLDLTEKNISDLAGIEAFTNLQTLVCDNNQLTSLDVSNNPSLYYLYCNNNQIPALDLSNNPNLIYLYCTDNLLTNLDVSNNTNLTLLGCWNNQISDLNVSNCTQLQGLYCNNNQLTSLDVSNNSSLNTLYCTANQLSTIDLSNNQNLTELYCGDNQLSTLDLSNNPDLKILFCNGNQLTSLDISNNTNINEINCRNNQLSSLDCTNNSAITGLDCSGNQLTNLDVSNCPELVNLGCFDNQLTNLDCSNNVAIESLDCSGNQLTSLDISNCPELVNLGCFDNQLSSIDLSNNVNLEAFGCGHNQFNNLDLTNNTNLGIFYCGDNNLSEIDISNNPVLTEFSCFDNQLTFLDLSNNPVLQFLDCMNNSLTNLDLSSNTLLIGLNISEMPTLGQVCVSTLPFPPDDFDLIMEGSPNVFFTIECTIGEVAPCTTHDEYIAGDGFRVEKDLAYFPNGEDLTKYIQRGDVIALSAKVTDKDYIQHYCICNEDTTSTLHGPYSDPVYYEWTLTAGGRGKLIIPDDMAGTVFYELPTCITEEYVATVNLTVKNGENSMAEDMEIYASFTIEVEPCPLLFEERDGSVPAGWGGLLVTVDPSGLSNGEDGNQASQEDALCFPEDIVFNNASDIKVNGEIKVSAGEFCKPDYAVLVTADANDLDSYKLKCQGETGCESEDSLVKNIHDPVKYEWSIIRGKGEFPLGNTGKSVVFHKSRSDGADLKCVITDAGDKANDGSAKELYISLEAAEKPRAFVGLGDDEETFTLYKYFYEKATDETIYVGRNSAFMSTATSMKSSLEDAGYEVEFREYVSKIDVEQAVQDPIYQAMALVGHGSGGRLNMAGRDQNLGTQTYTGTTLIADNEEAYDCSENPRIRDLQLIGCEALRGNWSAGLHCGARLHGWKTTKALGALRYYAFWEFTPLPPINLSLE